MILQCPGCHKRLSLDDRNEGKIVKCPACGQQFRAGAQASRLPEPAAPPVADKVRSAPPPAPQDPGFDVVDDDYDIVEDEPPAEAPPPPAKKVSAETLKSAIAPTKTQRIADDEKPQPDDDEEYRRKNKKKKKKKQRAPGGAGAWIPYAVGLGCLLLLVAGIAMAGVLAGEGERVLFAAVYLVIAIPISTVILVISMVVSSAIAGGIEFGEVQVVIPKAIGLLIVAHLLSMIPFIGFVITFPIWLFGLMFLFRLDLWEARFLIFINWFLNTLADYAIFWLVVMLVGGSLSTGPGTGSSGSKGQDDEARALFREGTEELKGWLQGNDKRIIYTLSREGSVQTAQDLYVWGGIKVWAGNPVENTRSGIPFTKKVIVELPRDNAAGRKKIIDYHNEITDKRNGEFIEDVGQRYVVINYEAKDRFGH